LVTVEVVRLLVTSKTAVSPEQSAGEPEGAEIRRRAASKKVAGSTKKTHSNKKKAAKGEASKTLDAVKFARAEEALWQEHETFEQRKKIENNWSVLRLVMGYSAVVLIPSIMSVSVYILFNHAIFPANVVWSAGGALFGDSLGLVLAVWKIVLNPGSVTRLDPVTKV
jgi:hypothetical protein